LFRIVDIEKLLGIKRDQLFYWFKTKRLIKPMHEAIGRGRRSEFSLDNLFQLSLVQKLTDYGIELGFVREILTGPTDRRVWLTNVGLSFRMPSGSKLLEKSKHQNVLNYYRKNRTIFQKEGLLLMVFKIGREFYQEFDKNSVILEMLEKTFARKISKVKIGKTDFEKKSIDNVILINVMKIIEDLEKKTGEIF